MEDVVNRSSTFKTIGWICFALAIIVTPVFALLGIVSGFAANSRERSSGKVVIWANAILLIASFILSAFISGFSALAFFSIIRMITGR